MSWTLLFLVFSNIVYNFSCLAYGNLNHRREVIYRNHKLHAKFVPPPPPEGGKGEWNDWDNESFMDDEFDVNESGSADPFFIPLIPTLIMNGNNSSNVNNVERSQFEDSWSEEPPYFDEDDIDDYEEGKFTNSQSIDSGGNDKTYPNNPNQSNKDMFASAFTPSIMTSKASKIDTESINAELKSQQQTDQIIHISNTVTLDTLRNLIIDQNKILELKLQQSISNIERNIVLQVNDKEIQSCAGAKEGGSDMNTLKTEINNLSNKLNIALAIVAVLLILDIKSL